MMVARIDGRLVRSLATVVLALGLCAVSACGSSSQIAATESTAQVASGPLEGISIGFVGVGQTEGARAAESERNTVQGLKKTGARVLYYRAQSLNPQPQIEAAQRFANQKVNVLVIDPEFSNVWGDAFATMRSQGIHIILLDRKPLSLRVSRYDTFIGANTRLLGSRLAQWVIDSLGISPDNHSFEDGGIPRAAIVSSLRGSAQDQYATDGWQDAASGSLDTVISTSVGQDPDDATDKLVHTWTQLAHADQLPHVIFATNTVAAEATIRLLTRCGVHPVRQPSQALSADARVRRTSRGVGSDGKGTGRGWSVAVVAIGQYSWLKRMIAHGKIARGQALPTSYASMVEDVVKKLAVGDPVPREITAPVHPVA